MSSVVKEINFFKATASAAMALMLPDHDAPASILALAPYSNLVLSGLQYELTRIFALSRVKRPLKSSPSLKAGLGFIRFWGWDTPLWAKKKAERDPPLLFALVRVIYLVMRQDSLAATTL